MNREKFAITGIGGFIGRQLASALRASFPDACIVALGRGRSSHASAIFDIDLLDTGRVRESIDQIHPDYIFHLAGVVYSRDWRELHSGNVQITINILEAVREVGVVSKIIVPGSAAEYGGVRAADLPLVETLAPNPVTPYGVAKVWQTSVARYYATTGLDVVVGRIFNVIGPGAPESLSIGTFASQLGRIKNGEAPPKIMVGNLKPKRDFVDIRDVCQALITLAKRGKSGEIYNICSGASASMEHLLGELITRLGLDVEVSVEPARVKMGEIADIFGSYQKIRESTGWEPAFSLSDSVASVISDLA